MISSNLKRKTIKNVLKCLEKWSGKSSSSSLVYVSSNFENYMSLLVLSSFCIDTFLKNSIYVVHYYFLHSYINFVPQS